MKFGWNCEIWLKFGWNCEIWSKLWDLVEIWLKLWNLVEIVKFVRLLVLKFEVWGLKAFDLISQEKIMCQSVTVITDSRDASASKKLVPEKSTDIGTGKIWSRKKYLSWYRKKLVPEKSTGFGAGKNSGYRHTLPQWPIELCSCCCQY